MAFQNETTVGLPRGRTEKEPTDKIKTFVSFLRRVRLFWRAGRNAQRYFINSTMSRLFVIIFRLGDENRNNTFDRRNDFKGHG